MAVSECLGSANDFGFNMQRHRTFEFYLKSYGDLFASICFSTCVLEEYLNALLIGIWHRTLKMVR